jgi:nicotinamidase/pyrazinamidase
MKETVFGISDAQRGFMTADEGEKVDRERFGELPVTDGQRIVPIVKRLLWSMGAANTFTTQDWHPEHTAHFAENPDYVTNWPVHCVGDTKGAELHPALESALGPQVTRFYKGQECLEDGKDDLSYSGYYGTTDEGLSLPEWLIKRKAEAVVLGGLALDYCVGKTALDLRTKMGLEVTVAIDATRGIADESVNDMLEQFKKVGIETVTSAELLNEVGLAV